MFCLADCRLVAKAGRQQKQTDHHFANDRNDFALGKLIKWPSEFVKPLARLKKGMTDES
jgi:hypothetical protein